MFLPPEVEKFVISEKSMEDILAKKLDSNIRSLDVNGDKVHISLPNSFLTEVAESSYGREIDSVEIEGDEVEVILSKSPKREKKDNGKENFSI